MQATLNGNVIADSNDLTEAAGYSYFPQDAVRTECLRKADKTARDLECPHGVQFYDVVIDGAAHARAAWQYEAPKPKLAQTAGRFGFWRDVKVG